MRKMIFIILIILLLIATGFIIVSGLELGNFQIFGMRAIKAQNEKIDNYNQELSNLVSVTYPETLKKLMSSSEALTSTKKDYEEKSVVVSNSKLYMQTEKYEIEYLWTKLGNYAKDNNVQIKIDVVNSATTGLYDLKFIISGNYANITDFIYDIENDSKLGFKIEELHMVASDNVVQGSFTCKEIRINIENIEQPQEENKDATNNTTNNTTDNTTTNNTTTNNEVTQNTTNTQATNTQ